MGPVDDSRGGWAGRWRHAAAAPHAPVVAGALLGVAAAAESIARAVNMPQTTVVGAAISALLLCLVGLATTIPPIFLRPVAAAVTVCLASVLSLVAFRALTVAGAVAVVVSMYRLGYCGSPRKHVQLLAVGLAVPFLVLALVGRRAEGSEQWVLAVLLSALAPAAAWAGIAQRARNEAMAHIAATEDIAGTLFEHTARGERARIARELHDVVAHHISMIAVQAETARLTTPGMPEAGARRLSEIGDTARAGLTEMRRLLGVLREDAWAATEGQRAVGQLGTGQQQGADLVVTGLAFAGLGVADQVAADRAVTDRAVTDRAAADRAAADRAAADRHPQPGLSQLNELIDEARDASGVATRLIISGPVATLDPGVELAAYRIVQEALTNSRRHAPGAAIDVELRYADDALRLRIRDNGPGPPPAPQPGSPPPAPGGHGLLGMRERAAASGGQLRTGAAPGGGFLVEATLPVKPEAAL